MAEDEAPEAGLSSSNDCEEVATSKGKKEKHGKEVDFLEPLGQMQ